MRGGLRLSGAHRPPLYSAARRRPGQRRSAATGHAPSAAAAAPPPPPPATAGGSRFGWAKWTVLPAAAAALFGGIGHALATSQQQAELDAGRARAERSLHAAQHWISELASRPGVVKAFDAEMLMEADHPILEDDHMFSGFITRGVLDDLTGYYDVPGRRFYAVVSLGREVCGFPRVVHGGLTAAICDEAFGGLMFALRQAKALSFWGPAYTVALNVEYKAKMPAGRTILCCTEVESMEGRKLWMRATVSDGPDGQVYATARALFVAPKPLRMAQDIAKYLLRRVFGEG